MSRINVTNNEVLVTVIVSGNISNISDRIITGLEYGEINSMRQTTLLNVIFLKENIRIIISFRQLIMSYLNVTL